MYAVRVGLRGMTDPHSNWNDTGAGVGVGPVVSDGLAGGGSSTPVVPPPVGGAFPYNNTVHQRRRACASGRLPIAQAGDPAHARHIGQLELAWATSPYATCPDALTGTYPIHFIDNTSAIAGLIKGYARPIDSAMIVTACSSICVSIQCLPFFAYVRSKANIADLPSRMAISELINVLRRLGWLAARGRVGLPSAP